MSELKPCPFCGGEAKVFHIPENDTAKCQQHPNWMWKNPGMYVVGCHTSECIGNINNCAMYFFSEERAAKTWNRRAADE